MRSLHQVLPEFDLRTLCRRMRTTDKPHLYAEIVAHHSALLEVAKKQSDSLGVADLRNEAMIGDTVQPYIIFMKEREFRRTRPVAAAAAVPHERVVLRPWTCRNSSPGNRDASIDVALMMRRLCPEVCGLSSKFEIVEGCLARCRITFSSDAACC